MKKVNRNCLFFCYYYKPICPIRLSLSRGEGYFGSGHFRVWCNEFKQNPI